MRDEKLSLESSSTLYVIVCVCVCVYIVYLTQRERENARDVLRVRVFKVQMHNNILSKRAERAENKSRKSRKVKKKLKKQIHFLFKKGRRFIKNARATKKFHQTLC